MNQLSAPIKPVTPVPTPSTYALFLTVVTSSDDLTHSTPLQTFPEAHLSPSLDTNSVPALSLAEMMKKKLEEKRRRRTIAFSEPLGYLNSNYLL